MTKSRLVQTSTSTVERDRRFPRSKATRDRILAAARRQFSEVGYERTTIRSVAGEAEIDPSMVMRYFETKDGLFAAALTFDLALPDLTAVARKKVGETVIAHFLDRWEGAGVAANDLPALLRSATSNEDAMSRLLDIFKRQVLPSVKAVCPPGEEKKRGALLATQILGLAYGRYVLKLPAIAALDHRTIKDELGPTLQRYICGSS